MSFSSIFIWCFIFKILTFFPDFLITWKDGLIRKIMLVSKFMTMTLYTRKQIITIYVLPNISISKDSQAMKFFQLTECNIINIFLEKPHQKLVEKLIWETNPFSKTPKFSIYLCQQSQILYSLFLLYVQVEDYQIILKPRCWPLVLSRTKLVRITKRGLEPALLPA